MGDSRLSASQPVPRSVELLSEEVAAIVQEHLEVVLGTTSRALEALRALADQLGHAGEVEEEEAEVGYVLHPDHQGKGLMQEALHTVLDYGFDEMQLRCILAEVHPDNIRSIALLVRNGFRQQSVAPDTAIYALERQFRISTVASK